MNRVVSVCGINVAVRDGTCDHDIANSVIWEDEYQLRNHAVCGGVFADIGAYCGHASLFLAMMGMTGVALEPIPENVEMIGQNMALNGQVDRVQVVQGCLGGDNVFWNCTTSQGNMHRFIGNSFGSESGGSKALAVRSVTLEELLEPFDHIDLLKTDCEGGEWALVNSPHYVLAKVELIIGEFHPVLGDYEKFIGQVHGFDDVSDKFGYKPIEGLRLFALKRKS